MITDQLDPTFVLMTNIELERSNLLKIYSQKCAGEEYITIWYDPYVMMTMGAIQDA